MTTDNERLRELAERATAGAGMDVQLAWRLAARYLVRLDRRTDGGGVDARLQMA
jgi:hypothetical protein